VNQRVDVRLPQWGMGMQEGTILRWLKQVGESVVEDEPIAEVEAAKVESELLAPAGGVLAEVIPEGTTVAVHETVAVIEVPVVEVPAS
jgi:pyruvate/2-oxoglutarate dehydrogenase complex dihydrolipoamide acyltransferase (E2) component